MTARIRQEQRLIQSLLVLTLALACSTQRALGQPSASSPSSPAAADAAQSQNFESQLDQVWLKISKAEELGLSNCAYLDSFDSIKKGYQAHQGLDDLSKRLKSLSHEIDDQISRNGKSAQSQSSATDDQTGDARVSTNLKTELDSVRKKITLAWGKGVGIKIYSDTFNAIFTAYNLGEPTALLKVRLDSLSKALDNQLIDAKNIKLGVTPGGSTASKENLKVGGFDYSPFMSGVQRRIKLGWFPPKLESSYLLKSVFVISTTGEVSGIRLLNPHQNSEFNDAAIKAIQRISPVLRPEEHPKEPINMEFTFNYNKPRQASRPAN